jgi:hypothetical protein
MDGLIYVIFPFQYNGCFGKVIETAVLHGAELFLV